MAQDNEDPKIADGSESEIWSASDCRDDVRDFWDRITDSRIDHIGRAPSPQQYSSTITSIETLDEEKQALEDAMHVIRHRCANEEQALQKILEALREHLEFEEHAIARSIATIHNHRNLLVPVMRLPPEILSQIFVFHAQTEESWLNAVLTSTHVCKQWWQIGRACPELWSHISEDCHSAAWMEKMIERSCAVPLSLTIGSRAATEVPAQKMALIADNMHRFGSFDLHVPREPTHYRPFFETFSLPTPLLQHLTVTNYGYSGVAFPPEFLGGSVPNLRHMKLSTIRCIPWDSALFAHLTTLNVSGSENSGDEAPPSLRMLLSALAKMPELETLVLRRCLPSPTPSMAVYAHVDLSNLKRLEVAASWTRCTTFLRQITIDARATVLLELTRSSVSRGDLGDFLAVFPSHLYTTSSPTAQALRFTWGRYHDFGVDMWTVQQDATVKSSQNARIKLVFSWEWDPLKGVTPFDLMWACFATLASPQLHSFRISDGHIPGWDVEVWRKFAQMVPDLRTLAPGREVQCMELCKALSPPDGSDLVPADCCLPALSYLELEVPYDDLTSFADRGEPPLSVGLACSLAARASIGCSTPDLVFVEPGKDYPEDWLEPFKNTVPGIRVYTKQQPGEGYMNGRVSPTYYSMTPGVL